MTPTSAESAACGEPRRLISFVLFALAVHGASLLLSARAGGVRLEALSVYFDGHLYLEIARSFPLPYSAEGIPYTGLAPGSPALNAAMHLLGLGFMSWGAAALLATLRGLPGAWDFERLAILAWPAALLILWPALLVRMPVPALAATAALLLAFNLWVQARRAEGVVPWQLQIYPFLRETAVRLDADEPRWFDFAAPARAARPAVPR